MKCPYGAFRKSREDRKSEALSKLTAQVLAQVAQERLTVCGRQMRDDLAWVSITTLTDPTTRPIGTCGFSTACCFPKRSPRNTDAYLDHRSPSRACVPELLRQ